MVLTGAAIEGRAMTSEPKKIHEISLYNRLLGLPLFQGMSRNDMLQVIDKTRFGFRKIAARKTFAGEGDPCRHLLFLLKGTLYAERVAHDGSYRLRENTSLPLLIELERLFGLNQKYACTYTTVTDCHFMTLEKSEVLRLQEEYEIFRYNLLNTLCTFGQKQSELVWQPPHYGITAKIVAFIDDRSLYRIGEKRLYIKVDTFARLIGESQHNLSRALKALQEEKLIVHKRGILLFPDMEKLRAKIG